MGASVPEGIAQSEFAMLTVHLDIMRWPFDTGIASKVLRDTGYAPVEQQAEFVRASKPDGEFLMDRTRNTIRFDGFPPGTLADAKERFEGLLERNTGVVLGDLASYYESQYVLIYLAKRNLHDALAGVYDDSAHMKSVRGIVGRDVRPSSIDVSGRGSRDGKSWFRIAIEPKAEGTDRTYFCTAVYRDASADNAIRDAVGAAGVVKGLLCMLEDGSAVSPAAQL